jgi:hypothetical protein
MRREPRGKAEAMGGASIALKGYRALTSLKLSFQPQLVTPLPG